MRFIKIACRMVLPIVLISCDASVAEQKESVIIKVESETQEDILFHNIEAIDHLGRVNAIIEIPSGGIEKWELNKSTGKIERDSVDGKQRTIHYLGYPGNYGMIPKTILSKDEGGDGDPLDILVLGEPAKKGSQLKCEIIGVFYLVDQGERDDKLIGISTESPLFGINEINELDRNYPGILEIIEIWFSNYKGPQKMNSNGFGGKDDALQILKTAIKTYKTKDTPTEE